MSLRMFDIASILPFLDAEGGAGGGTGGTADGNTGGQQSGQEGQQGGTTQPFATFPDSASFSARMDREANQRLEATAKELGFESVDAWKSATAEAKTKADAEKSELDRAKEAATKAENDRKTALETANSRIVKAEAKLQAAALGIKPERVDAALRLADLSGVTVNDAGDADVAAITAAVEAVLALMPELKGAATNVGGGSNPPGGGNANTNPWTKEHFNLTEQARILRENPTQAQQFIAAAKG